MVKFKTTKTTFDRDPFAQWQIGSSDDNPTALKRLKTLLRKLLKFTPVQGVLELNIANELNDPNAFSGNNPPAIIVTNRLLKESDTTVAMVLGHELGHIVLGTDDQIEADKYGTKIALKAGYKPENFGPRFKTLRELDPEGEQRIDAIKEVINRSH